MSRWLCLVFLLGCNVPQDIMLRPAGLWTSPNKYDAPPGSLSKANNARIVRPGLIEQRRGFANSITGLGSSVGSVFAYNGGDAAGTKLVYQYGSNIKRASVVYSGTNSPPTTWAAFAPPTRFAELLRRLYATTNVGVRRFDTTTANGAGIAWAPDISTASATTGSSGFLPNGASAIYRVVWKYVDPNGFVLLGAPSGPATVTNSSGTAANVLLSIIVPPDSPGTFQVYRSVSVTGQPSDDLFQTYEGTTASAAGATVTIVDSTPDVVLGDALYTNATNEGALAANFRPPYASDLVYAFNKLFFLQTKALDAVQLDLLEVGTGLRLNDIVRIAGVNFTASTSTTSTTFAIATGGTATQNITTTARNLVEAVNAAAGSTAPQVMGHYISSANDAPGQMWIESTAFTSTQIPAITFAGATYNINVGGLVRSSAGAGGVTATTTAPHGLVGGDQPTITCADPNFPTAVRIVLSTPTTTTFTYTQAGAITSSVNTATVQRAAAPGTRPADSFLVDATPQTRAYRKNSLAWSKDGEPDAVPEVNYAYPGGADAALLRGIHLRDSLFLFKEDGLWIANDDGQGGIYLRQVDPECRLVAPRSAVVLAGSILAWTTKGIVPINESGVGPPISDAIDYDLRTAIATAVAIGGDPTNAAFKSETWAVAYEEEGLYQLYVANVDEGVPAYSYVYSIKSKAWTKDTHFGDTSGFVNPSDGLLYVGTSSGTILVERKALAAGDYKDEDNSAIGFDVKWNPAGNPFTNKRFAEAQFLLQDSTATAVTANFSTDQQTTDQTVSIAIDASYANGPIRTEIPLEASQGTTIAPGITHAVAGEKIMIAGVMVDVADGSGRTRK